MSKLKKFLKKQCKRLELDFDKINSYYMCSECGSLDIDEKVFRGINTYEILSIDESYDPYCNDCEKQVRIESVEAALIRNEHFEWIK